MRRLCVRLSICDGILLWLFPFVRWSSPAPALNQRPFWPAGDGGSACVSTVRRPRVQFVNEYKSYCSSLGCSCRGCTDLGAEEPAVWRNWTEIKMCKRYALPVMGCVVLLEILRKSSCAYSRSRRRDDSLIWMPMKCHLVHSDKREQMAMQSCCPSFSKVLKCLNCLKPNITREFQASMGWFLDPFALIDISSCSPNQMSWFF